MKIELIYTLMYGKINLGFKIALRLYGEEISF